MPATAPANSAPPTADEVSSNSSCVVAALRPVAGRDAVARYLAGYLRKLPAATGLTHAEVNGGAGVLTERDGALTGVIAFVSGGAVRAVRLMLNRDKLAFVERQLRESR